MKYSYSHPERTCHAVISSGSRIEMGEPRCKFFSHDPMSGARGAKGAYFHTQKVKNWGQGAMAPVAPLDQLLVIP